MAASKNLKISIFLVPALCAGLALAAYSDRRPILIESLESKTADNRPVYNVITWQQKDGKDIWSMRQSHHGLDTKIWDELSITVDKSAHSADFVQKSGFSVSCYLCHASGPRAIRPNYESVNARINVWNRLRIELWNLRIKTYGPLATVDRFDKRPVRWAHPVANEKLQVTVCLKCHNANGAFARQHLTKQNFMAIRYMVENKLMPPWPYSLDEHSAKKLKEFLTP